MEKLFSKKFIAAAPSALGSEFKCLLLLDYIAQTFPFNRTLHFLV